MQSRNAGRQRGGNTMTDFKLKERRGQQRIRFEAPATVTAGQHSIAASTKDISDRGLFFFTDAPFELGREFDIVLMLPEELPLPISGMVCCHGRVVRIDPCGGQQYGIAVEVDRVMPMPQV
jgi:PilZ domain-containing protein